MGAVKRTHGMSRMFQQIEKLARKLNHGWRHAMDRDTFHITPDAYCYRVDAGRMMTQFKCARR
jgi:hypothetical protein